MLFNLIYSILKQSHLCLKNISSKIIHVFESKHHQLIHDARLIAYLHNFHHRSTYMNIPQLELQLNLKRSTEFRQSLKIASVGLSCWRP